MVNMGYLVLFLVGGLFYKIFHIIVNMYSPVPPPLPPNCLTCKSVIFVVLHINNNIRWNDPSFPPTPKPPQISDREPGRELSCLFCFVGTWLMVEISSYGEISYFCGKYVHHGFYV